MIQLEKPLEVGIDGIFLQAKSGNSQMYSVDPATEADPHQGKVLERHHPRSRILVEGDHVRVTIACAGRDDRRKAQKLSWLPLYTCRWSSPASLKRQGVPGCNMRRQL